MSIFDIAIQTVLLHEGLYVNDKQDPGGATNYGISLRWLQEMEGQDPAFCQMVDSNKDGQIDLSDVKNLSRETAIDLYYTHWWQKYGYGQINDQSLATKVFDLAVNMGPRPAHRCLQRAIRAACGIQLNEDGILGPKTLETLNKAIPTILLATLKSEAAGYYRGLNKDRYEKGWLNRAYA